MENKWIEEIKTIFKAEPNRYLVHEQCKPFLEKMAISKEFLYDVIRVNLGNPDFLNSKRHYSTLAMKIEENSEFTFVMNIFPPLPNRRTDISFQSIHHHGSLLLSTVGVHGPGYQSILFNKDYTINTETGETKMSVFKNYKNKVGVVDFVDSNQPHIVFYPTEISATYALWCDNKRQVKEAFKKISWLKKIHKPIAFLINKVGLSKILGLNKVEYFDFYTNNGKVIALKDRLAYDQVGDNDNFLKNIFHFIQKSGFNDVEFLHKLSALSQTPDNVRVYINKLIENEFIEDEFFIGHLNIPKVNLQYEDVLMTTGNA